MARSKLLVEKEDALTWRVVARECTRRGLSKVNFVVISNKHPNLGAARRGFAVVKGSSGLNHR